MKKMYSDSKNWTEKKYKESFEKLVNDGYDFNKLELVEWFQAKLEDWKWNVMQYKYAKKIVEESEKAIKYNIVNQYGNEIETWFPKSAIEGAK